MEQKVKGGGNSLLNERKSEGLGVGMEGGRGQARWTNVWKESQEGLFEALSRLLVENLNGAGVSNGFGPKGALAIGAISAVSLWLKTP